MEILHFQLLSVKEMKIWSNYCQIIQAKPLIRMVGIMRAILHLWKLAAMETKAWSSYFSPIPNPKISIDVISLPPYEVHKDIRILVENHMHKAKKQKYTN